MSLKIKTYYSLLEKKNISKEKKIILFLINILYKTIIPIIIWTSFLKRQQEINNLTEPINVILLMTLIMFVLFQFNAEEEQ